MSLKSLPPQLPTPLSPRDRTLSLPPMQPSFKPSIARNWRKIPDTCTRGGTLIFGGVFSSFSRPSDIKNMFTTLGLRWESGDYHRTTCTVNPAMAQVNIRDLVQSYSQKALHLKNVRSSDAIYLPSSDSRIQSMVFAPDQVDDHSQTPAAFGPAGRGKVGYLGDVNAEDGTTNVLLAMCGVHG